MKLNATFAAAVLVAALPLAAAAASLTTTYAGGNGQKGNMFNITIGANDITVTSFDLNIDSTSTTDVEFYLRQGGYQGAQTDASAWTLVSQNSLTALGSGNATVFDVTDQLLTAGSTYGIYLTTTGSASFDYTNGTSEGALYASNADLSIYEGLGVEYAFSYNFSPRVWNGSINYTTEAPQVPLPASALLLMGGLGAMGVAGRRKKA